MSEDIDLKIVSDEPLTLELRKLRDVVTVLCCTPVSV